MASWQKLPPLLPRVEGCGTCGPAPRLFPMQSVVAVGFGQAEVLRDGVAVLDGEESYSRGRPVRGADAEALADKDPDHDWRIRLHGPLSGQTYQRHAPGEWVLVAREAGFA